MARLHISAVLRELHEVPADLDLEAASVAELFVALRAAHPAAAVWFDEDGSLVEWLTLFLDGVELTHPPEPSTPLAADADLDLLAHAAGG